MEAVLSSLLAELISGDDDRAEAAALELSGHGAEITPLLKELLASSESETRWWVLRAMAQMPVPPAECFITALSDKADEIRQCAALGLCHHPDEAAIPQLICLLSDTDPVTAELASRALAATGPAAVPALLEIQKEAAQGARLGALRALAEINDPRAIPAFMSALEEDSISMHYWAEQGLDQLGLGMVYFKPE